jgi:hypothetical protein
MEELLAESLNYLPELIEKIIVQFPIVGIVLSAIGSLVFLAQLVVAITPSKEDDAKLEGLLQRSFIKKIWDLFLSFAPFQKKDGKIKMSKDV